MSCEVSLYPLGVKELDNLVNKFIQTIKSYNLKISVGQMSTYITGDLNEIFNAVKTAYNLIIKHNSAVMIMKITNACPVKQNEL